MKSISVFLLLLGVAHAAIDDDSVLLQHSMQPEEADEETEAVDIDQWDGEEEDEFVEVPIEARGTDTAGPPLAAPAGFNTALLDSAKGRALAKDSSSRGSKKEDQIPFSPVWWMAGGKMMRKSQEMKNKVDIKEQPKFSCKTWADSRKTPCDATKSLYLRPSAPFMTSTEGSNFTSEKCCLDTKDGDKPAWKIAVNAFMPNGNNVPMSEIVIKGPTSTFMKDWHKTEDGAMLTSIEVAKYACYRSASCHGFTHQGTSEDAKKAGAVWVYFKTSTKVGKLTDSPNEHWTSYVVPKTTDDKIDFIYMSTKAKGPRRDVLPGR